VLRYWNMRPDRSAVARRGEGGKAFGNIAQALAWVGFYNAIDLKDRRKRLVPYNRIGPKGHGNLAQALARVIVF
jgi:hypothetical protein